MSKHIIVLGAGKSSTCLINYLLQESAGNNFRLTVADSNLAAAQAKTGDSANARALCLQVEQDNERKALIATGDIIISMLPPALHYLVAEDCLDLGKHLLTASYLDERIAGLSPAIAAKNLLFLCEMGLDPGIDHMSAMQMIDNIRSRGGKITSFLSHCGGLVAPQSDNNPWRYKVSWNPHSVVRAGNSGARFREQHQVVEKSYAEIFRNCREAWISGLGRLACYPNRDSLAYIPRYHLEDAATFIRTTLRYPVFCSGWECLVLAGLTNDQAPLPGHHKTYRQWSENIIPFLNSGNRPLFEFLGLFDEEPLPVTARTSADVLQYLVETRMAMQPGDQDMIVMLHEITYTLDGKPFKEESTLIVTGQDSLNTAMARTVGLPLGIAARLLVQEKLPVTGLHIPIIPEIYEPVLRELSAAGIRFRTVVGGQ